MYIPIRLRPGHGPQSPPQNRRPFCFFRTYTLLALAAAFLGSSGTLTLQGQMIRTGLPMTRVNSSFYERIGIDFGFSFRGSPLNSPGDRARGVFGLGPGGQLRPNLTFSQGGVNSAIPPFGGYDPGADATFGYHLRNSQGGYHLGFRFGKGSNRSIVNTTPVLMTQNGYPGSLFNGTANPFVTGIIPVVGSSGPMLPDFSSVELTHPLELKLRQLHLEQQSLATRRQSGSGASPGTRDSDLSAGEPAIANTSANSTASRGDLSVLEIKRQREQRLQAARLAEQTKVNNLIAKAESAFSRGQIGAARSYLRTAIRYASGQQKSDLQQQLEQWK